MRPTTLQRLDQFARNLMPVALTFLLLIIGLVPIGLPTFAPVVPAFTVIAVFYWTVHRPDLMPVWIVFLLGLMQDLVSGQPLGVGIVTLLLVRAVVASQPRFFFSASFGVIWFAFALIVGAVFAVAWLLNVVLLQTLLDPRPAVFQYLTTAALYPCLAWIFAQAQRAFLR